MEGSAGRLTTPKSQRRLGGDRSECDRSHGVGLTGGLLRGAGRVVLDVERLRRARIVSITTGMRDTTRITEALRSTLSCLRRVQAAPSEQAQVADPRS
jgi:hypothetical protein